MTTNITEIIPDDIPEWAKKAMDEGQFFNAVCGKIKELEDINFRLFSAGFSQGYGADINDINRIDELFERTLSVINGN